MRVLVVEDEAAISLLLEDMLEDMGFHVIGPAARLDRAIRLASTEEIDLAVLDVNIAGEKVYPVAELLDDMGVPYIFSTGYGVNGIRDDMKLRPVIQKPFTPEELEATLAKVAPRPV